MLIKELFYVRVKILNYKERKKYKMCILILGGTGEISRYVVKKCRDQGHRVVVLNRGNKRTLHIRGVDYRYADTNRREELVSAAGGDYDKIIDFTTYDKDVMEMKIDTLQKMCRHYIFISSVASYERKEGCKYYTEDMALGNSKWPYGHKKSCCEELLRKMYDGEKSRYYTIIRPGITYSDTFIPYSPIDTYNMPGYLINCLLEGRPILTSNQGEDMIQVLHALDFTENLYMLLNLEESFGEAFNLSGDDYMTSNEIAASLVDLLGKQATLIYLPKEKFEGKLEPLLEGGWHDVYSNRKAKRILKNYQTGRKFKDHLQQIVNFYFQHQEWMVWPELVEIKINKIINDTEKDKECTVKIFLPKDNARMS